MNVLCHSQNRFASNCTTNRNMEFAIGSRDHRLNIGDILGTAPNPRRRIQKRCPNDCDLEAPSTEDRLCRICGEELVEAVETSTSARDDPVDRSNLMESLFDFFGEDLRAAIEASNARSNPQRQISQEYMSTLGKIVLDERRGLLYDVFFRIGPLSVLAVPASFGPIPHCGEVVSRIVIGKPECGDADMLENAEECIGSVVLLKRGKVSFATKTRAAQRSGASAVIVIQTADMWPFVMTDSAGELLEGPPLSIPVVMISQSDARLVEQIIGSAESGDDSHETCKSLTCCLNFGAMAPECSICQEDMNAGQVVLKLVCRHAYHEACVRVWLETHNTCPLCRHQMPVEQRQVAQARVGSNSQQNSHTMPYFH